MHKILLYYKFVPLADPQMTMRWQRELCLRLNLKGRIIIAAHGINGTLGGHLEDVKAYVRAMNLTPEFKGIEYKWSDGSAADFPKLSVKVRHELVTLAPEENFDVYDKGTPLRPAEWHAYLEAHPEAIVFDARNNYESDVGRFKNAITPDVKNFKDVKQELDKLPKDQPVLTYCTGDIRCEYLSAYMKHKGFGEVYHLDGGIVKYGQAYGDDGFWEGRCYVFDARKSLAFSDKAKAIGYCANCGKPTSRQENCAAEACNLQFVICDSCAEQAKTFCSNHVNKDITQTKQQLL